MSLEVHNKGIRGPTNITDVLRNIFNEKKDGNVELNGDPSFLMKIAQWKYFFVPSDFWTRRKSRPNLINKY